MYNWCANAPTSPIQNYSQYTVSQYHLLNLTIYLIYFTYTILQHLYISRSNNILLSTTKLNPPLTEHKENRRTRPKRFSDTKRSKRKRIRRP